MIENFKWKKINKKIVIGITVVLVIVVGTLWYVAFRPPNIKIRIEDWVSLGHQEPDDPSLDFHVVIHTTEDNIWLHDITVETYVVLKNGSRIEAVKRPLDIEPEEVCYIQFADDRILCRRYVNASYVDISSIEATVLGLPVEALYLLLLCLAGLTVVIQQPSYIDWVTNLRIIDATSVSFSSKF